MAPTEIPKRSVTMFAISVCAVFVIFSKTPLSFTKLPNIKNPINGAANGTRTLTMIVVKIGKAITTQLGIFVSFSAT